MARKSGNPKGNPQNLTPFNKMDKEKAKEIHAKGGKASGVSKRKRKAFKQDLLTALEIIKEDNKTIQDIGVESLMARFMAGDLKAFEIVRDTIGEKPTDKQEVKVVETDWFV